jgi:hypothetical protein
MSARSLDVRREVSIVTESRETVKPLDAFYQELRMKTGARVTTLPGDRAARRPVVRRTA